MPVFPREKSDYEKWQDGFGADWDKVVANSSPNLNRVLHIYEKRKFVKLPSGFPLTSNVCVYNKNQNTYRTVTLTEDRVVYFEEEELFINTTDSNQYLCVIYSGRWLGANFFYNLPVVYINSRSAKSYGEIDQFANGICLSSDKMPLLRGVDCNKIYQINIHQTLEHLSFLSLSPNLIIGSCSGTDANARILKKIIDKAIEEGVYWSASANINNVINFSDLSLADWFYTTVINVPQNYGNVYLYNFPTTNNARRFKYHSKFNLFYTAGYLRGTPSAELLEGTITENQTVATRSGAHGFNAANWTVLRNFPMWTVLNGSETGCLRPAESASSYANFVFYSNQLVGKYFAQFDANGNLDLDPTKTFVANLPFLPGNVAQKITFDDKTFVNQFTPAEQDAIEDLVVNQKKWILEWK